MGDIVGLVEKAQAVFDQKQTAELERKMAQETLSLEDYLEQLQSMKKMGSMKGIIEMLPGPCRADRRGEDRRGRDSSARRRSSAP